MVTWQTHDKHLAALSKAATRDLWAFISQNENASVEDVQRVMRGLAMKYGDQAAASAFQAIRTSRETHELWGLLPAPELADPVRPEVVDAATAWALQTKRVPGGVSPREAFTRLVGSLVRFVNQPARETVMRSAAKAKVAWARVPTAKACAFCLMLASRGAVYTSRKSALETDSGARFHDKCHCLVIESYSESDLPKINHDLKREWDEAGGTEEKWREYIRETRPSGSAVRPRLEVERAPHGFSLTEEDWRHVLVGEPDNVKKGGHLSGVGRLNKTEFPRSWDEARIREAVEATLSRPQWSRIEGDRLVLLRLVDGVVVRVAYFGDPPNFRDAYPISGRGVVRNTKDGPSDVPLDLTIFDR